MQSETTQPIEEAHAEAIVANDKVIAAEQIGGSIAGAEAVEEAKAEASGTLEQLKADRETARLEAQKAFESSYTGVSESMKLLDRTFAALLKASEPESIVAGQAVPLPEKTGIPISADQMPAGSEAQAALNAAMIGAAAEVVIAAPVAAEVIPVANPEIISEVPLTTPAAEITPPAV